MHGDQTTPAKSGFMQMLRPHTMGAAAHSAITWFKPPLGFASPIRFPHPPVSLGRMGPLEVRLAQDKRDVKRAQKLRYKVFYKDGSATRTAWRCRCRSCITTPALRKPGARGRIRSVTSR